MKKKQQRQWWALLILLLAAYISIFFYSRFTNEHASVEEVYTDASQLVAQDEVEETQAAPVRVQKTQKKKTVARRKAKRATKPKTPFEGGRWAQNGSALLTYKGVKKEYKADNDNLRYEPFRGFDRSIPVLRTQIIPESVSVLPKIAQDDIR